MEGLKFASYISSNWNPKKK